MRDDNWSRFSRAKKKKKYQEYVNFRKMLAALENCSHGNFATIGLWHNILYSVFDNNQLKIVQHVSRFLIKEFKYYYIWKIYSLTQNTLLSKQFLSLSPSLSLIRKHTRRHHHHHHEIILSLSLSCSLHLSTTLSRSSKLYPVSVHSWCSYVLAGRPTLVCPCVGVHKKTLLVSMSLLFQHCLASCTSYLDGSWDGM